MAERTRSGAVVLASFVIGALVGFGTEVSTNWLEGFLGVNAVVILGLGIVIVEGPALVAAIVISRRVVRTWVRNALQATAPFLAFFAYLVAYGIARHPPFSFPFALPSFLH